MILNVLTDSCILVTTIHSIVSGQATISAHPAAQLDQTPGSDVTFSVTVTGGTGPLTYSWLRTGQQLSDSTKYGGLGTNQLTVMNVQESDEGFYSVSVVDFGTFTFLFSNAAQLTLGKSF